MFCPLDSNLLKQVTPPSSIGASISIVTEIPNPETYARSVLRPIFESDPVWGQVTAAVVFDDDPSSAEAYATRRATGPAEVATWRAHLADENISSMSNALIFIKLEPASASTLQPDVESLSVPRVWSAVDENSHSSAGEVSRRVLGGG